MACMELFLKEHTFNQVVLCSYSDYSRKIVTQLKMNQNVVFTKANPTSKACEKFLINAQLEFKVDLIPQLINVLRNYLIAGPDHEDFCIVSCYENWQKENIRLIVLSSSFGGEEILQQKKIEVLEEEDMVFSEDAEVIDNTSLQCKSEENWEDMFGSFYIKKTNKIVKS